MLDSTWVSQSVVWLQATGSSRGDSRSEDYVSIFLPIFDQFCFLNATFMLNSLRQLNLSEKEVKIAFFSVSGSYY